MKKFLIWFALCVWLIPFCSGMTVTVTSEPGKVVPGGEVLVKIEVDKTGDLDFILPEVANGRWLKNSMRKSLFQSHRIVNFQISNIVSNTCSLLLVNLDGKDMTIPSFEVKCGGESARSRELVIPVAAAAKSAAKSADSTSDCVGRIIISGEHYVGEKVNFELELQLPENFKLLQMEAPRLSGFPDATFSQMQYVEDNWGLRNGAPLLYRCRGSFTPWQVGEYDLSASQRIKVIDFESHLYPSQKIIPVIYTADAKLKISTLPKVPENVYFLGLIGKWDIHAEIIPGKLYTGDGATLIVSGTGRGNIEMLTTPEINLPGFRCYPGEVKKNSESFQISYPLVALEAGNSGKKLQFAVFDAQAKRYVISEVNLPEVLAGRILPAAPQVPETTPQEAPVVETPASVAENSGLIPVLRKSDGGKVRLPLWENCRDLIIVIFLCAVAIATSIFIWTSRRINVAERQAKKAFVREKDELMKMLATGVFSAEDILPRLAAVLKLPAGATAEEIISASGGDAAIREIVEKCEEAEFSPEGKNLEIAEKVRLDALSFIRKLSLILLCAFCSFSLFAADGETEFYGGNYRAAAEKFRKSSVSGSAVDVNMLYDLGCAEYNCGNFPAAKSAFFRAHLLAPWDREIAENLDRVNAQLGQPIRKRADSFGEAVVEWQNKLRPDNYLLIGAIAVALLIVLTGLCRLIGKMWFTGIGIVLLLVIGLSLRSSWQQTRTTYDSRQAVAIANEVHIRALPQENSQVLSTISGGSRLLVLDRNIAPWLLVECNGTRGWVEADRVELSLPGGVWGK